MKKIIIPIFIFLVLISTAFADGGFWIRDRDQDLWRLHSEEEQFCAISYKEGYQNMLLTINIGPELTGEKAVWIFPVPSEPENSVIEIVKEFPRIYGYDVRQRADENIKDMFSLVRATQIYPIPFELFTSVVYAGAGSKGFETATASMVEVYEHIEKYGLTTELITAKDGTAFYNYIAVKGLELPEDAKQVFNSYIGKDYSFVVSWISDIEEFKKTRLGEYYAKAGIVDQAGIAKPMPEMMPPYSGNYIIGVQIGFPTERIYFPLMPTSVYGSKRVPATIYVMDYVIPDFYTNIERDSTIEYYYAGSYYVPAGLEGFFFNQPVQKNLEYTKIKINPPSKMLTDDLWMDLGAPESVKLASSVSKNPLPMFFAFWIICSVLASVLSALIVFRKDRPSLWGFVLWGLWNLLSIVGFIIATIFMRTKTIDSRFRQELRRRGLRVVAKDPRKIAYVIMFSILFVALSVVFEYLLMLIV
jgi:hypothetical protein